MQRLFEVLQLSWVVVVDGSEDLANRVSKLSPQGQGPLTVFIIQYGPHHLPALPSIEDLLGDSRKACQPLYSSLGFTICMMRRWNWPSLCRGPSVLTTVIL